MLVCAVGTLTRSVSTARPAPRLGHGTVLSHRSQRLHKQALRKSAVRFQPRVSDAVNLRGVNSRQKEGLFRAVWEDGIEQWNEILSKPKGIRPLRAGFLRCRPPPSCVSCQGEPHGATQAGLQDG